MGVSINNDQNQRRRLPMLSVSMLLVVVLGYLDYITGPYLYFITFYLIPIYIATWFGGKWWGFFALIASAVAWAIEDISLSASYIHPLMPYWNLILKLSTFGLFIYVLANLKDSLERENKLATTDFLTGVANRRYFFEVASREIERSKRYGNAVTVIYLDIDNFKYINDIHGHAAGDKVLRLIGKTLRENIRNIDLAARMGGDEFAVVFPETGYENGQVVIRRIKNRLQDAMQKNDFPATFSIGGVTCVKPTCTFQSTMAMADIMMYAAKKKGKNQVMHEIFDNITQQKALQEEVSQRNP